MKIVILIRLKSGRLVSRSVLGSPTKDGTSSQGGTPVMAKDEGWVDDDTTVPTGWRTKEYVNKGKIYNFISVFLLTLVLVLPFHQKLISFNKSNL